MSLVRRKAQMTFLKKKSFGMTGATDVVVRDL